MKSQRKKAAEEKKAYIEQKSSEWETELKWQWVDKKHTLLITQRMSYYDAQELLKVIQAKDDTNSEAYDTERIPRTDKYCVVAFLKHLQFIQEDKLQVTKDASKPNLRQIVKYLNAIHSHNIKDEKSKSIFHARWTLENDRERGSGLMIICKAPTYSDQDGSHRTDEYWPGSYSRIRETMTELSSSKAQEAGLLKLQERFKQEFKNNFTSRSESMDFIIRDPSLLMELDKLADNYFHPERHKNYIKGSTAGTFENILPPEIAEEVLAKMLRLKDAGNMAQVNIQTSKKAKDGKDLDDKASEEVSLLPIEKKQPGQSSNRLQFYSQPNQNNNKTLAERLIVDEKTGTNIAMIITADLKQINSNLPNGPLKDQLIGVYTSINTILGKMDNDNKISHGLVEKLHQLTTQIGIVQESLAQQSNEPWFNSLKLELTTIKSYITNIAINIKQLPEKEDDKPLRPKT